MDRTLVSHVVHNPDNRQTQTPTQTQSPAQLQTPLHHHEQRLQPQQVPLKRRRANSVKSSVTSTSDSSTHNSRPTEQWSSTSTPLLQNTGHASGHFVPRNISPGGQSRVSLASSLNTSGPQLRKKPKSSSIKDSTTIRTTSAVLTSSSVPAFHFPAQPGPEPASFPANNIQPTPQSVVRTNSSNPQLQSPNQKRPPASHSSYGVETTCGPPPSYSTQRTLSQERIRKVDRNSQPRVQNSSESPHTNAPDDTNDTTNSQKKGSASPLIQSSPDTVDTQSIPTPTEADNMANITIRGDNSTSTEEERKMSSSDERRSEDLFLNIAKVDAARPVSNKSERRRSRISIPMFTSNRPPQEARSSPVQSHLDTSSVLSSRAEAPYFHNKRASLGSQMPGALSSRGHLPDVSRVREQPVNLISDSERDDVSAHTRLGRRSSTANTESTRLAQRSSTGLRSKRFIAENNYVDRPKTGEPIATESTISTTAPSTVWDELDDLKTRIRKLELTGKLPPSSAAAMGSNERPRTATTAATTMSGSPKYKTSEPNVQPNVEAVPPGQNPLLYDALANARSILHPDVFSKLQATAQDALQLAALTNESSGTRNYPPTINIERQLRRRTESMCRSLTELAIALAAESKPAHQSIRPASRDQSLPPNSMLRSRRYSNDPGDRGPPSARVQSRLDSRRTSIHIGQGGTDNTSPDHAMVQSPNAYLPMSDSRLNRSSNLLRRRTQGSFDGVDDSIDASPSVRPASRAMTELGAYRRISRDQLQASREYTSQHPLPTQTEHSAATIPPPTSNANSTFSSRRKYTSPASVVGIQDNTPVTPRDAWGHISIVAADTQTPDVASEVGGSGRAGSSRRSLGFASRIGSSVGSRLRAARAERNSRDMAETRNSREMASLLNGDDRARAATTATNQPANG